LFETLAGGIVLTEVFAKMFKKFSLAFAAVAMSTVAFAQGHDGPYLIGFAANLNIGDSAVNISNDGYQFGFYNNSTNGGLGNLCANVYTFDPSEEEILAVRASSPRTPWCRCQLRMI
jgi:hypothetical protein